MKNFFIILFLAVYVTLSVGMNVLVHSCSGESQVSLATTSVKDPCVCEDESSSNQESVFVPAEMCCTTIVTAIQIDDVQKIIPVNFQQKLDVVGIAPSVEISTFDIYHSSFVISLDTSPPPNKDFQISNSVFLI